MSMQADRINGGIDITRSQQRLAGRGKTDSVARDTVIKRLDTETIARQKQLLAVTVPDREREYTLESLGTCLTPLGIRPEYDLRVAGRL